MTVGERSYRGLKTEKEQEEVIDEAVRKKNLALRGVAPTTVVVPALMHRKVLEAEGCALTR